MGSLGLSAEPAPKPGTVMVDRMLSYGGKLSSTLHLFFSLKLLL